MALEKDWDIFSSFNIPTTLRNIVSQTFSFKPLKKLGTGYYRQCSARIARNLQSQYPKCKIFLARSEEAYRSPGAFDLNFLLVREKEIKEKELWDLRSDYFEMRRKFPMFGEIFYTHSGALKALEASDSASSTWFWDRKRFNDGKWKVASKNLKLPDSLPSRVASAIFHFSQAQEFLVRASRGSSNLYLAKFYIEIGKVLWICSGENLGPLEIQAPASLVAQAFYQIQKLAESALSKKPESKTAFEIAVSEKNGSRFLAETLNRSWIVKLKRMDASLAGLRATSCPLILTPFGSLNLVGAINLFTPLVQGLSSLTQDTREVPLIIPQAAWELMIVGWHWKSPLAHTDWVYPYQIEDLKWRISCGNATLSRLKESILLDWNLIPGKLITGSPENIHQLLRKFFWSLLTLEAGTNLSEGELIEKHRKHFPVVCKSLQLLNEDKRILNLQSLLKTVLDSQTEISEVVSGF